MMLVASACLFVAWVLLFCNKYRHMSQQLRPGWVQDPQQQWFSMAHLYSHRFSMEKFILLFTIAAVVLYVVDHVLQRGRCFVHRWLLVVYVSCMTSVCGYEFFEKAQENLLRHQVSTSEHILEEYSHESVSSQVA